MSEILDKLKHLYKFRDRVPKADRVSTLQTLETDLASSVQDPQAQLLLRLSNAREAIDSGQLDIASTRLHEAEEIITQSEGLEWMPELQRLHSVILRHQGRNAEAFDFLIRAYTSGEAHSDHWSLAHIAIDLGVLAANSGDYDGASVYLKRCLEHSEFAQVDPAIPAHAHLILAQAQLERGALDEAYYHASQSFSQFRSLENHPLSLSAATLYVSVSIERQDFETAREVLNEIDRETLTKVQLISFLNLEAKLCSLEGNLEDAIGYHDAAIDASSQITTERLRTNSIQLKCETLLLLAKADEALILLKELERGTIQGYDLLSLHELKGKALEQLGRYQEAFEEVKKFAILQKELLSERASNALSRLRAAQEVLQAEREAAHFRERSQFYAKELSQRTSYLVQQNTYVSEVIDHIKLLSMKRPDAGDLLKDIQKKLRQLPAATFDWEEYLRLFDEIHPNAIPILKQQYPELSETEAKICSLALAKLSNIEIGRLLTITERTVENHRHRLRKKLGLTAGTDLTAFLEKTLAEKSAVKTKQ